MAGIRPELRDHPLMLAARYNDAQAEETSLLTTLAAMGLEPDVVMYVAEQRAVRVAAVVSKRPEMKALLVSTNKPMVVPRMTADERRAFDVVKLAYLDGLAIGWKAQEIKTRAEGDANA